MQDDDDDDVVALKEMPREEVFFFALNVFFISLIMAYFCLLEVIYAA